MDTWTRGETAVLTTRFVDGDGSPASPADPQVTIKDPAGAVVVGPVAAHVGPVVGTADYSWLVPLDAEFGAWTVEWSSDDLVAPVVDGFWVALDVPEGDPAPVGPCRPWVTAGDLSCDLSGLSDATIARYIAGATEIVWMLSGRRLGECQTVIRPCRHVDAPMGWHRWGTPWDPIRYSGEWLDVCPSGRCVAPSEFLLPAAENLAVAEVVIEGVTLDPSAYELQNGRLVRVDGGSWPTWQDFGAPLGDPGTWSVTVEHGAPVPEIGKMAAADLACELLKAQRGDGDCRLPARVTSLTRLGETIALLDPLEFLRDGRTGLYLVDLFLTATNPASLAQAPGVFSPDEPGTRRSATPHATVWPDPTPTPTTVLASDVVVDEDSLGVLDPDLAEQAIIDALVDLFGFDQVVAEFVAAQTVGLLLAGGYQDPADVQAALENMATLSAVAIGSVAQANFNVSLKEDIGVAAGLVSAHEGANDPHGDRAYALQAATDAAGLASALITQDDRTTTPTAWAVGGSGLLWEAPWQAPNPTTTLAIETLVRLVDAATAGFWEHIAESLDGLGDVDRYEVADWLQFLADLGVQGFAEGTATGATTEWHRPPNAQQDLGAVTPSVAGPWMRRRWVYDFVGGTITTLLEDDVSWDTVLDGRNWRTHGVYTNPGITSLRATEGFATWIGRGVGEFHVAEIRMWVDGTEVMHFDPSTAGDGDTSVFDLVAVDGFLAPVEWVGTGGAAVAVQQDAAGTAVSAVPPGSPQDGALWFNTDTGKTYCWLDAEGVWVEVGSSLVNFPPVATAAANLTLDATHYFVRATVAGITVTLPTAVGLSGRTYNIDNDAGGPVTVAADGAETIQGLASQVVPPDSAITVYSTGSAWRIT